MSTGRTRLLIDAGLSRRELARRLAAIGEDIDALDAVLVTHEHGDHVAGLAALSRRAKRPLPIYMTRGCAQSMLWAENEGAVPFAAGAAVGPSASSCPPVKTFEPALELFQAGSSFTVGDCQVTSFTIPHDATDPVGFTLTAGGIKIALATDLGYVTDSLRIHLGGADLVILESNHDLDMLRVGPYPWSVKQRVMGRRGHLSNEVAAAFLENDLDSSVSTVVLGHISEHNNHPELVRRRAEKALQGRSLFAPRVVVAEPGVQSEVFCY